MLKSFNKFLGVSALVTLQIGLFDLTFNSASALAEDRFEVCAGDLIDLDAQLPPEKKLTPEKISAACANALHPEELSLCVLSIVKNTNPGILAEDALKSCYRVRRPVELARCVVRINKQIIAQQVKPKEIEKTETETQEEISPQTPTTPETPIQIQPPTETPPQTPPQPKEIDLEKQTDKPPTTPPETPIQVQPPTQPPTETQIAPNDPNLIVLALDNCRSSLLPLRFADCTLGLNQEIPNYPVQLAMTSCLSAEDNPSELLPVSNESR
jgi:hypothetical protein